MSNTQGSFTIKSSHKFVGQQNEPESELLYQSCYETQTQDKTIKKEGSSRGMVIKTNDTSVEDFY